MIEPTSGGNPFVAHVLGQEPRGQPLGATGPELGSGLGAQPAGEAHVIGMIVRRQDAPDRPLGQQPATQVRQRSRVGSSASPASITVQPSRSAHSQMFT